MAVDAERQGSTRGLQYDPARNLVVQETGLETGEDDGSRPAPKMRGIVHFLFDIPWWAVFIIGLGIFVILNIQANEIYSNIFRQLSEGISVTLQVSIISYTAALLLGALIGIIRSSRPQPGNGLTGGAMSVLQLMIYNVATVFVEIMRGLPILVVLLIGAFIITPEIRRLIQENIDEDFMIRGQSMETAIIALSLAYSAFISEIFRAGIQSVDKGQVEAARSLGMTSWQTMRLIIMPQAIRRVLPPLGNDFIAIIKDSSLVALLAVQDVTQLAKKISGANFRPMETYLTVAVIYLSMTFIGSLLLRGVESYLQNDKGGGLKAVIHNGLQGVRTFLRARPTRNADAS